MNPSKSRVDDLSPKRRALLESLLRQKSGESAGNKIRKRTETGPAPLSFAQQRMWFLDQLAPGHSFYAEHFAVTMNIPDPPVLERAVNEIVRRHEALRTIFAAENGTPVQIIAPSLHIPLTVVDLQPMVSPEREHEAVRISNEQARQPFDLSRGPLVRTTLLQFAPAEGILLLTLHHIVQDGWSMEIFFRELNSLYTAYADGLESPLDELPVQYADYAIWQRDWLLGDEMNRQVAYWRRQLNNLPVLQLPLDYPRPPVQTFSGALHNLIISAELARQLRELSQRNNASFFMTLFTAFMILLHRYTGQDDLAVGSPVANRDVPEIQGLIGCFVNMLVLRVNMTGEPTFTELLARVKQTVLEANAHQDLPFEKLVEDLQPERDLSRNPLIQVAFHVYPWFRPAGSSDELRLPELRTGVESAKFDLRLDFLDPGDEVQGGLEYSTNLFDAASIERMSDHYLGLLENIVANPDRPIWEIPLLRDEEHQELLRAARGPDIPHPRDRRIHQIFEEHCRKTPDASALIYGDTEISYAELNRRSNQLAHYLGKQGVGPDKVVGICMDRSIEMGVAVLAVLKAGGAYLPLDPDYPSKRIEFMIEDSEIDLVLTQEHLEKDLPLGSARAIQVNREASLIAAEAEDNLESGVTEDNLAYMIYTSGSTGIPKGVQVNHRGIPNVAYEQMRILGVGPGTRSLQFSSLCFDAAVIEFVTFLCSGATLVLAPRESMVPGPHLIQLLREHRITNLLLPPSALAALPYAELPDMSILVLAGEAFHVDLIDRWQPGRRMFNYYGPTETTILASYTECQAGVRPHIGTPIANFQLYVLDAHKQLVPRGVAGELYIGGVGVARGYWRRPELDTERFLPDPFSDDEHARLYRTGDLVRCRTDGNLEFLGRVDHQVKLRGFRIELGEIEAVLSGMEEVQESVAMIREDAAGDKRIVAYIVPRAEASPSPYHIRQYLRERLPEFMVPSAIMVMSRFPLHPNGKIDRAQFPAPDRTAVARKEMTVLPRTELEKSIADVWKEVLRVEVVGVDDNFFDLGGNSLLLVRAHSRLQKIESELAVIDLFRFPTVAALAERLGRLGAARESV